MIKENLRFELYITSKSISMPPKQKSKTKKSKKSRKSRKSKNLKNNPDAGGTSCVANTRFFQVPNDFFKNKEDVIKGFGYALEKQIAKGGFGTIYTAVDLRKKTIVACKWMDLGSAKNDPRMLDTKNELFVIEKVRHPYIIKLFCHFIVQAEGQNNLYIFMELAKGGDLYKFIQKRGLPNEDEAKLYWAQILCGINHMHNYGIAHRDIKPQNVLLVECPRSISGDYLLQVTDFGLSCKTTDTKLNKTICGTPVFMAPELLEKKKYSAFAVDIWALGVTLFLVMCLEIPFNMDKPRPELIKSMKEKAYALPENKMKTPPSQQLKHYISCMMEPDVNRRMTLFQAITYPWVKNEYTRAHNLSDEMKLEKGVTKSEGK